MDILKKPIIVNFFGSSGVGKSTQAAGLFYHLKMKGIECELVCEKAKDLTWEKNITAISNQFYVSANQTYRQERLEGKVDVIVNDSPIITGLIYYKESNAEIAKHFTNFLLTKFKEKDNINILLERKHEYSANGRNEDESISINLGKKLETLLIDNKISYLKMPGTRDSLRDTYKMVLEKLELRQSEAIFK